MLDHYRLLKFTYGLTTSPFLAVQVLKQLAEHSAESYPDAYAVDILRHAKRAKTSHSYIFKLWLEII